MGSQEVTARYFNLKESFFWRKEQELYTSLQWLGNKHGEHGNGEPYLQPRCVCKKVINPESRLLADKEYGWLWAKVTSHRSEIQAHPNPVFCCLGRVPFTLALTLWKHCEWPWSIKSSVAFWSKAKNNASIKNCKANSQPMLHSRDVSFSPAHIRWSHGKVYVWLDQRHWHEYWSPNVFCRECLHFFIINLT